MNQYNDKFIIVLAGYLKAETKVPLIECLGFPNLGLGFGFLPLVSGFSLWGFRVRGFSVLPVWTLVAVSERAHAWKGSAFVRPYCRFVVFKRARQL